MSTPGCGASPPGAPSSSRFGQMTGMLAVSGPLLASISQLGPGPGGRRAGRSVDAARPGAGGRPQGLDRRAGRRLGLSRRAGGQAVRGVTLNMTYEAGLQALDPRNFSGPAVGTAHRHQVERRRAVASRPVLEAGRRAHRRLRRLRHPRHRAGLDPVARRWRRHRAARRLHRQVHEQGGSRRLSPAVTRRCPPTRARSGASSTTATCSPSTTARTSSTIRS